MGAKICRTNQNIDLIILNAIKKPTHTISSSAWLTELKINVKIKNLEMKENFQKRGWYWFTLVPCSKKSEVV